MTADSTGTANNAGPARDAEAGVLIHAGRGSVRVPAAPPFPVPFQCPPPARRDFVNRSTEREQISAAAAAVGAVVVTGMGGIGKTALVLAWAHEHGDQFPDGHLHADLSARDTAVVEEILPGWLLALGVAPEAIPATQSDRIGLWRTVTRSLRLLLVVDGATDPGQVRSLLPASPTSLTLVASRRRLGDLAVDGVRTVSLAPVSTRCAIDMLTGFAGETRAAAEPRALATLAKACQGHPWTVCTVGSQLAARPRSSIAAVSAAFLDHRSTSRSVQESALMLADHHVTPPARRLFLLLPFLPGADFTVETAAVLLDCGVGFVDALLSELLDANLVVESGVDRFTMPLLVREYALNRAAGQHDRGDERAASTRRVVEHYLRHAAAVEATLAPGKRRLASLYGQTSPVFDDRAAAAAWFEAEWRNLVTAQEAADQRGWAEIVWQFAEAVWTGLLHGGRRDVMARVQQRGADAAERVGHLYVSAAYSRLGWAFTGLGEHQRAVEACTTALRWAEHHADDWSRSTAHAGLGRALVAAGDPAAALPHIDEAYAIDEARGEPRWVLGLRLRHRAAALRALGRHDEAVDAARRGVEFTLADPDRVVEAGRALTVLGDTQLAAGLHLDAITTLQRALPLLAETPVYLADALMLLGDAVAPSQGALAADGRFRDAARCYESAGHPGRAAAAHARVSTESE
ncbi:MAG TPA: tetratricopeptide repeat protein [Umezawaea sp.]|nr:tetratricopeptide repeat protein [Umezawaea sp.]